MIKLESVDKVYRTNMVETQALSNINIEVLEGEFISIMGPSGCGKSTLLNLMGLLDEPSKGTISIAEKPITTYNNDKQLAKMRNTQLGFIFQSFHLINDLTVADNVEIPLLYRKISGSDRRKAALEALDMVGLSSRVNHYPSQLSGGQQQRVAIARAIAGRPKILLADEPTGNLDSQMGDEILDILMKFNKEDKTTIVMVTHDQRFAEKTERTIRLFDGRQVN
ncbi:MAG: ABC transporter ATP-binding protein [bacterium]|nr:ABC transporter ATP-binding protein [bacterium]